MQEDKKSMSSYFITLTHDCEHVPITKNGFMDLSKRDLQLFFKRIRRLHDRNGVFRLPLKYYAVGEYGGRFKRPHYHIIAFNFELALLIGTKYAAAVERGHIELDGKYEFYCPSWDKGHITIGTVSEASVGYTMKYVSKPSEVPMHKNDDRTREFPLMSKGLGKSYLTAAMMQWHLSDMHNRQYVVGADGKKFSLPRYYKDKLLTLQDKEILRALNQLEAMKERKPKKQSSRERSEAYYAGKKRFLENLNNNQKF